VAYTYHELKAKTSKSCATSRKTHHDAVQDSRR
jgi:hypothetical protein